MTDAVLITGGLGYVGGRIAQALAQCGQHRLRLATRAAGHTPPPWLRAAEIVTMDVTRDADLDKACDGVTGIVHLVALNEHDCAADPQRALLVNSLGTLKLLHAAQRARVERFIYFSTAHVYGAPLAGRIDERSVPRPVHPYAITHHVAEDFVLAAHDQRALTGIVLRMSNGFGAPAHAGVHRWTLIVNDLCRQAVTQKQLVLHSSGVQQRDFITLADAGRAVDHLLHLPVAACGDGLFNLGGERALSVIELTGRIANRCEVTLGFRPAVRRPQPAADETGSTLDYRIDKLKQTGFELRGGMDAEIDATLRLCKEAFGAAP
ncbi:MAG: SDR family oxidoreductase [Betaproteobacteria bacterium]|nr:SDR family oxidoreductase [Betaproteobacteria bacterium]